MKAMSGSGEYSISATPNTPIERQILAVVARNAVIVVLFCVVCYQIIYLFLFFCSPMKESMDNLILYCCF